MDLRKADFYKKSVSIPRMKAWQAQSGLDDFIPSLLETYGMYKGTFYALPFKPDVQLLFYRKDLFEDEDIQADFKEKTGNELKVPETIDELYETAAYFTKSLNPDSPVEYGYNMMGFGNARFTFTNV